MKNQYNLDVDYFEGKLKLNRYTPGELSRELERLSKTAYISSSEG